MMSMYCDVRYGDRGKAIWIFSLGPFVILPIITVWMLVMGRLDFEDATPMFIILLVSGCFLLWVLAAIFNILVCAPRVAQYVHANERAHLVTVRLYFGRTTDYSLKVIDRIDSVSAKRFSLLPTLLNSSGINYCVWLEGGRRFWIPGHIPGAKAIVNFLQKGIEAQKKPA
jgi:hypothetical protein